LKHITIIGSGAVGKSLAVALHKNGVRISGIYSLSGRTAAAAAKSCSAKHSGQLNVDSVISDIVLLAVPDSVLPDVVRTIAANRTALAGKVIVHTSGTLNSDELLQLRKRGASVGSFHPLQTFPKRRQFSDLTDCWFAVEGDAPAVNICKALAKKAGGKHFLIAKKDKTLYHIAAVFASNYQVTLFSVVEHLAETIRIPRRDLWRIFRPLIVHTMENVFSSSAAEALTGPIARGDYRTIMKHIAVLESSKSLHHLIPLYSALGVETAKLIKRKH